MIKFLLISILVIWFLSRIAKFFLKLFLKDMVNNLENKQKAYYESQKSHTPEGSIRVDKNPTSDSKLKNGGEYVDYEVVE